MALQSGFGQGLALHLQGDLVAAERIYGEVLDREPQHFDALHMLGVVALQTRRTERAIELIRQAIELNQGVAAAHNNLGMALLKYPEEALASFDRAIALSPDFAEAHGNRGNALRALARAEEALSSYDRAIALDPDFAQAYRNRGTTQLTLKRPEAALASFDKAILLKPNLAEAYLYRGNALQELKRPEDALASLAQAIALKPDYIEAYRNRGHIYSRLKRYDEAFVAYDKAYSLNPDLTGIEGHRLDAKTHLCNWKNRDSECASLIAAVAGGKANTQPFIFLAVPSSSSDQLQCAKLSRCRKAALAGRTISPRSHSHRLSLFRFPPASGVVSDGGDVRMP